MGRSSELDMVLVEDMVSRRHAKITVTGGQIFLQDLGSTNGSFVNGEKIKRARLNEGDRILIGTSIIKVVATDAPQNLSHAKARLEDVAAGKTHEPSADHDGQHRRGAAARSASALLGIQEERHADRPHRPSHR